MVLEKKAAAQRQASQAGRQRGRLKYCEWLHMAAACLEL